LIASETLCKMFLRTSGRNIECEWNHCSHFVSCVYTCFVVPFKLDEPLVSSLVHRYIDRNCAPTRIAVSLTIPPTPMHDPDIRNALRTDLHRRYGADPDTAVIDELSIRRGGTRVDLALVNGVLHGFELKSDYDSLCRLAEQVQAYGSVCNRATLVVGERHVKNAADIVPDWWGIRIVRSCSGRPTFRDLKLPQTNPSLDPMAIARLLRRSEAYAFIADLGWGEVDITASRRQLCDVLASRTELQLLCHRVRCCIRARQSGATRRSCGD
jgi:hypothetical protein